MQAPQPTIPIGFHGTLSAQLDPAFRYLDFPVDIDKAYSTFQSLRPELEACVRTANTEQDARLRLVDRLLTEVLGWPRNFIETEKHQQHGFADYVLGSPERKLFVIEAKKSGAKLIDSTLDSLRNYKLRSPALRSAQDGVQQAQRYCIDNGVAFAALTTGLQWIAFRAIRTDGKPVNEGLVFAFPSFDSINQNFVEFFELFAYTSHLNALNEVRFQAIEGAPILHNESVQTIADPNRVTLVQKTGIAADMDTIFREFFASMSSTDQEMLAKCFVESKESKEADVSMHKLTTRLVNSIKVVGGGPGGELERHIEAAVESSRGEFVLVVGNKGSGKSTFIGRFFRLILDDAIRKRCLLIHVDLADSNGDIPGLIPWLVSEIQRNIELDLFDEGIPTFDQLQGIFWDEYSRWRVGPQRHLYDTDRPRFKIKFGDYLSNVVKAEKETYVQKLIHHAVRSRKLLPCLVFDNADHFPQPFQECVFQYAQSIFRSVLSFIICPITDRTIWQLSKSGPFQSYETTAFYLPVPSTHEVLSKRIDFIREKLADDVHAKQYFVGRGIRLKIEDIDKFSFVIEQLFVKTQYLGRIVGWVSNHDIRRGLDVARRIATSPHLSIQQLISIYVMRQKATIKDWRVKKALFLGDYNGFAQDENSYILNCWNTCGKYRLTPLARLSILRHLADVHSIARNPDDAYSSIQDLVSYFEVMGMVKAAIIEELRELLRCRLIEPYDPTNDDVSLQGRIRITHCGRIHMEFCESDSTYVQHMAVATPITDLTFVASQRKAIFYNTAPGSDEWEALSKGFVEYCLAEDRVYTEIPTDPRYEGQKALRARLSSKWTLS